MATSEQCSRESTALHSDYYSTAKETANPLNEWWMTTALTRGARAKEAAAAAQARRGGGRSGDETPIFDAESKKRLRHRHFFHANCCSAPAFAAHRLRFDGELAESFR
jgi:hypothetical protein